MSNSTIDKLISMIFKTIKDSIYDISIVGETLTRVNALKLDATNISGYATALKGLSINQAELVLSTKGLTVAQQQAVLAKAELLGVTGKLTTAELNAILVNKKRNKDQAESLLIKTGLITAETSEATATNVVTSAKLKELVQTKALTQAEADLIAAKAGIISTNAKEASSFALLGDKFKSFGNSLLAIGKAHPILAVISIAIGAITTAVTIAEKKNEEFIETQEKLIEKIDENISKYDEEISSLSSLQEKLQDAKGDKKALASIQSELNSAIGNTPDLLNEESNAYDIANQKINDRIERLKELRKLELNDKVTAQKEIFDNTLVDNNWGIDHKFDYFSNHKIIASDTLGSEFDDYLEGINVNKFETLQSIFETLKKNGYGNGEKSNAEIWKELIDSYGGAMLDVEEIQNYFDNQTEYAQKILSDYVNNSESIFSEEELNSIIEDLVESGYSQDLEGIENVITSLVENDELEKTINDYYESLYNDDIDSDALYQNIKSQFDTLVANYPELKGILENYFNSIGKDIETGINNASQNPDEITVLSFKDTLSSEGYEDISKELKTLAEAGELTPNTLTSTKEYNKLLKDTNTSAQEATEQLYNMIDANERLATFSSNMGNVDKAYAEFKTNGFNTIDTLSGMQSAFGDLDYYNKFIKIAGDAKSSTEQIQEAYNKLVTEYVYSIGILDTVDESNRGMIQTQLEQLGITNAEEIVTKALNNEIMSLSEAKAILAQYSLNLESVTSGEINKLVTEGKVSNNTAQQIALFALKKKLANGTTITTDGDIKNLIALAGVSSKVIQMMYTLDTMKKKIASGLGEAGTAGGKAYLESKAKALEADIKKELNKGNSVNFNVDYSGGTATTDAVDKANKEATKSTTKFSQAIDWCAQTLSKLSKTIDLYSAKLENNTNSVKTQIKYYKELLNAQNNIVKGYAKTESKYKSTYTKALKKLSKSDQKKVKEGTYTIEQFSGKSKKSGKKSKAEKRYNNIQKALEARDNYLDAQTDSVNAKNQLQEYAEELASVRWDKAAEQVEKLNNEISVLDTKMSNVSGYKAKNKVLQEQLDLQKRILTKQENAYENTQSDANAYYKKISSKYKKNKNDDGTIKTSGVTNQTQLKYIKVYNAYVKKLAEETIELEQAQEDYTAAVQEATITRAENIKADYDNKLSLIEAKANELNSEIALAEAKGQVASAEYYKLLSDNSNQRLSELNSEKKSLESQLATLTPYSDAWYEVKQSVIEVDEAIADETLNAVENINKQIEAMEKLKKAKNNYLSSTIGTYDWLESLTDTDDYYNEDGSFSDKGKAVAKGKIDKIKLYEQQAKNAQKNIDDLDAMYANNKDDPTYLNKRIELVDEWQNATKSMYDEQQSLHDMYINGLKEESEALQELIDKKMESLKADKAEYDYQKSIAEKTKNITDLEKQLAMLEGDNSEEARAKRQKVKVELEEAQQDLEDTQYDKYLERLENSLGDLQDRFDAVIDKLDKQGAIPSIEELSTLVDSNSTSVVSGVNQIIKDAGLNDLLGEKGIGGLNSTVSDLLTTPTADITNKITTTNDWLEDIYLAMPDKELSGNTDTKLSLSDVLGERDLNNQIKLLAGDAEGKSDLNKYLMSQGYNDMNEKKMLSLVSAILSSEYTSGMNSDTYNKLASITSSEQLTAGKDPNSTDNKNAILEGLKYVRAKEFIANNATKAKYSRDKYGALNKKIYDITGGKVLNDANAIKLASMFNVRDNDSNGDINGGEGKRLVKLLEKAGFANGGIVEAVRKNGDDGLATLKVGEAVLTPVQTTAFTELAKNIVPFNNLIGDIVERPNIPTVDRGASMSSTSIDNINVEFSLPNVTDKESFKDWLQNDSWINRYFDSMITNKTVGGNKRFGANRL